MFPIPWYVAAFVSVPEAFLVLAIAMRIMEIEKTDYKKVFLISVIQGVITFVIRRMPVVISQYFLSSLHTVILMTTLVLMCGLFCGVRLRRCFIPIFVVSVIYGFIQYIVVLSILSWLKMPILILEELPWLDVSLFFPVAGMTVLLFYVFKRLNMFEGL